MSTLTLVDARQGGDKRGFPGGRPRLDLSTCVNTYGPHPLVLPAVGDLLPEHVREHPYGVTEDFLSAFADYLGVDESQLIPIRGITEGLAIIARILGDRRPVVVCPDYTDSLLLFHWVPGSVDDGPEERAARIDAAMARHAVVLASNPNNPLGIRIDPPVLVAIAAAHPDSLLVVDEAYADFVDPALSPEHRSVVGASAHNIVALRSPNKIMGFAGARTGAMWVPDKKLFERFAVEIPEWLLGVFEGTGMTAALHDIVDSPGPTWLDTTRNDLLTTAAHMSLILEGTLGEGVLVDSRLHFRFLRLPPDRVSALQRHLVKHRIHVRVFTTADRPSGMRIVAPRAADWAILREALTTFQPPWT